MSIEFRCAKELRQSLHSLNGGFTKARRGASVSYSACGDLAAQVRFRSSTVASRARVRFMEHRSQGRRSVLCSAVVARVPMKRQHI
jgi:hypothetical protein